MSAGSGLHCKCGGLALGCVLEHVLTRELAYNQHATRVRKVPHFVHECAEGEHKGTNYETSKILD